MEAASALHDAGRSAYQRVDELNEDISAIAAQITGLNELLRHKRQRLGAWAAGAAGELQVVRVLVGMCDAGWHVLADRRWPGTRAANIDVVLIGPGGVFVIDVKNWADPAIADGRLWRDQAPQDDEVDKLLAQVAAVEGVLAEEGLPPTEVLPLLVFADRHNISGQLGRVVVCGDGDLTGLLVRRGVRLQPGQVHRLVAAVDAGARPAATARIPVRPRPVSRDLVRPEPPSECDLVMALREAACATPIESWMTWLHPAQARLINQHASGPARIRGAAGTGKTVVALHRAKHLAASGRRVLFTSYVRNLPVVQRQLFADLAPDLVDRVEFRGVHSWAGKLLHSRGIAFNHDDKAVELCLNLAWARVGRQSALANLGVGLEYWKDEIAVVIKGRGLRTYDDYAALARVGRRTPLQPVHRAAVWAMHSQYEQLRVERGLHDWADLLLMAWQSVRETPLSEPYDTVIVDEVQDLSCVGLQLLQAISGDGPNSMLLVGDGQQAVYPGGFTLSEAGISVVGRSTVLHRNYRNSSNILGAALAVVADDDFDDLELERLVGTREVDVEREGGLVARVVADDEQAQAAALIDALHEAHRAHGVRLGDMAVLCSTNAAVGWWLLELEAAGIPAMSLRDYAGHRTDTVKVGTYQRSKGLEFAYVAMPDHDRLPTAQGSREPADAYRERAERERRQLFVAMTRARDALWLGSIVPPPIMDFVR